MLGALRNRLYTEERAKDRRRLEPEIEHAKQAVRLGKATATLPKMLEDAERRLAALAVADRRNGDGIPERLARTLDRLPEIVAERLTDLGTLLADHQIERGKQILAALDTKVTLHPCGDRLEVEITGRAEGIFTLRGTTGVKNVGWGRRISP